MPTPVSNDMRINYKEDSDDRAMWLVGAPHKRIVIDSHQIWECSYNYPMPSPKGCDMASHGAVQWMIRSNESWRLDHS